MTAVLHTRSKILLTFNKNYFIYQITDNCDIYYQYIRLDLLKAVTYKHNFY